MNNKIKFKYNKTAIVVATLLSAISLSACGGGGSDSGGGSSPTVNVSISESLDIPAQVISGHEALIKEKITNTANSNLMLGASTDSLSISSITLPNATGGANVQLDQGQTSCLINEKGVTLLPGDSCTVAYIAHGEDGSKVDGALSVNFEGIAQAYKGKDIAIEFIPSSQAAGALTTDSQKFLLAPETTAILAISNPSSVTANNLKVNFDGLSDDQKKQLFENIDPTSIQNADLDISNHVLKVDQLNAGDTVNISFALLPTAGTTLKALLSELNKEDSVHVTAANLNEGLTKAQVKLIPATMDSIFVSTPSSDASHPKMVLTNNGNQLLSIDAIETNNLPDGTTINQTLSSCQDGMIIQSGSACDVVFNVDVDARNNLSELDAGVVNIIYQDAQKNVYQTKEQEQAPRITIDNVSIAAQVTKEGGILVTKPADGATQPVVTDVTLTNEGAFTWLASTDKSKYEILKSSESGVEPTDLSVVQPTSGNACWDEVNGIAPGASCTIGIQASSATINPTSYLLQVDQANNLANNYQHIFTVMANTPSLIANVNMIDSKPNVQKIDIINNGTGNAHFSYQISGDSANNFETWDGIDNSWCTTNTCPNPCAEGEISLSAETGQCTIYVHSKGINDADQATLAIAGSGLDKHFELNSQKYMYASFTNSTDNLGDQLYRTTLPLVEDSQWNLVGGELAFGADPAKHVDGLTVAPNGEVFASGSTGIFKLSLDGNSQWNAWTQLPGNFAQTGIEKVLSLAADGQYLYIGRDNGNLERFNFMTNMAESYNEQGIDNGGGISGMYVASNGDLYLGTKNSSSIFFAQKGSLTIEQYSPTLGGKIYSLIEGNDAPMQGGGLGVYTYNDNDKSWHQYGQGFTTGDIYSLTKDNNTLYAGGIIGQYIYKYNPDSSQWEIVTDLFSYQPVRLQVGDTTTISTES
ncbi:hypothetical protein [Cysteiniphilum litorale]|uniref:hypothetical protein n=1 Tax=Cysteiniphilum litorale TaxID=2056700 RepID=UPI003F885C14